MGKAGIHRLTLQDSDNNDSGIDEVSQQKVASSPDQPRQV